MPSEKLPASQDRTALLPLLERTYSDAITLSAILTAEDLGRPTVCRDWDVRALVNHFLLSSRVLSRAAADLPMEHLGDDFLGQDPARRAGETLAEAAALWRRPEAWEGTCDLPRVGVVPKVVAASIAINDLCVHCWDLRIALGRKSPIDAEVATTALTFMAEILDNDIRAKVGYDPPVEVDAGASVSDRLLAFLGRRP